MTVERRSVKDDVEKSMEGQGLDAGNCRRERQWQRVEEGRRMWIGEIAEKSWREFEVMASMSMERNSEEKEEQRAV